MFSLTIKKIRNMFFWKILLSEFNWRTFFVVYLENDVFPVFRDTLKNTKTLEPRLRNKPLSWRSLKFVQNFSVLDVFSVFGRVFTFFGHFHVNFTLIPNLVTKTVKQSLIDSDPFKTTEIHDYLWCREASRERTPI